MEPLIPLDLVVMLCVLCLGIGLMLGHRLGKR